MPFRPDILVMMSEDLKPRRMIEYNNGTSPYHLCPRCFPYIDLYCEVCDGHGEVFQPVLLLN